MSTNDGTNVLVTGGCGYIGSALIPILRDNEDVSVVTVLDDFSLSSPKNLIGAWDHTDPGLRFRRGDVTEYGDVEAVVRDADTIIHLAAITGADSTLDRRDETFQVNLEGTENVVHAAGKFGVDNIVFASSCNLYGRAATEDIDETVEPDPLNPYAESKHEAEILLREAAAEHGFDTTALRMSTVYGYSPGIRFNLVVNHFVFRALTDRPLTVYGDGSNWRPFIHVQDAAGAFAHAACHPDQWPHPVYNVGHTDGNYQIEEIARIVRDELDLDIDVTYLEEEHPGPSYHVNFDRLTETGYESVQDLHSGIRDLANRFTGHPRTKT